MRGDRLVRMSVQREACAARARRWRRALGNGMLGPACAAAVCVCLCHSADPVRAQPASAEARARAYDEGRVEFVIGNIEFVLVHELAHVLIEDLDLPVIGAEESAADYIATAALLRADQFDPERVQRAQDFLLATANGLATQWNVGLRTGKEIQFWDSHLLTIQRFYDLICLVHGSDPETFAGLPDRVGMPKQRAAQCEAEYAKAEKSLIWLLDNYGRQQGDPPSAPIDLRFERAPTRVSADLAERIEASGAVQNTLERMRERFPIEKPFAVVFRACRNPQASWLPEPREVVICYELVDNYYLLGGDSSVSFRRALLGHGEAAGGAEELSKDDNPWVRSGRHPVPR